MTLGARCAAETPERFSIYPGRTCGFAAKILHLAGTDPEVRRGADRLLLKVKADLERELEAFVLNCTTCGLDVHWSAVSGSRRVIGRMRSPHLTAPAV